MAEVRFNRALGLDSIRPVTVRVHRGSKDTNKNKFHENSIKLSAGQRELTAILIHRFQRASRFVN